MMVMPQQHIPCHQDLEHDPTCNIFQIQETFFLLLLFFLLDAGDIHIFVCISGYCCMETV